MTNSVWQSTIQNDDGVIVAGAQITVVDEGTGLDAILLSTRAGASLSNPFFSEPTGFAQFYAAAGEYRIEVYDPVTGQTSEPLRYVRLGDSGSVDTGTNAGETPTAEQLNVAGGNTNWTSGNIEVFDQLGIGCVALMENTTGASIGALSIVPASSLNNTSFTAGGSLVTSGLTVTGSYKATHGAISANTFRIMTRVS